MTDNCVKQVDDLQMASPEFCNLTVEQLLYASIVGAGLEDTQYVLEHTDWSKWCSNVHSINKRG